MACLLINYSFNEEKRCLAFLARSTSSSYTCPLKFSGQCTLKHVAQDAGQMCSTTGARKDDYWLKT